MITDVLMIWSRVNNLSRVWVNKENSFFVWSLKMYTSCIVGLCTLSPLISDFNPEFNVSAVNDVWYQILLFGTMHKLPLSPNTLFENLNHSFSRVVFRYCKQIWKRHSKEVLKTVFNIMLIICYNVVTIIFVAWTLERWEQQPIISNLMKQVVFCLKYEVIKS